jgi:hypothetical protein
VVLEYDVMEDGWTYRKRVNTMLIVTTIYSMELETAKKLSAQEPGEENVEAKVPMEDREFLGIYQGMTQTGGTRD